MSYRVRWKKWLWLCAWGLAFLGCAGPRAYFNAYFNAQKAFDSAHRLHEKRLKRNPDDSVKIALEEKKLLERTIEKASKVLELHSEKENKYIPKSLFLIGEAYFLLEEYPKAIKKYDELEKAFPKFEEIEGARFHRAMSLFHSAGYSAAKRALLKYIDSSQNAGYKREAMEAFAELERTHNSAAEAYSAYLLLLKERGLPREFRGRIQLECAQIQYDLKNWEKAREFATAGEINALDSSMQAESRKLAALCLYEMGGEEKAAREMEAILKHGGFSDIHPEIREILAAWYLSAGKWEMGFALLRRNIDEFPASARAAKAYHDMGLYLWKKLERQDSALVFFDSASAGPDSLEYALRSRELAAALRRAMALREQIEISDTNTIPLKFLLAEIFLFDLDNLDSALVRLDGIVAQTARDSLYSLKAAYARAFVVDEFLDDQERADSLYRYVLEEYPNTEYAKQAEANLGRVPSVTTDEDGAHELFLKAEELRFSGYDLDSVVIPAYRRVVEAFAHTQEAAKAQYTIAVLYESIYDKGVDSALYGAKKAYADLRARNGNSPFIRIAGEKLTAAGIGPRDTITREVPEYRPDEDPGPHEDQQEQGESAESEEPEREMEPIDVEEVLDNGE